ncbi:MAG: DUF3617 domain-containing protein [Burkholderiaceae bacterium]
MTIELPTVGTAAAATLLALSAQAQTLKPGLWEVRQQTQSGSGQMEQAMAQMQQQMASMSPEQRKMMEDMMARQGMGMNAGDTALKVCLTREMVERNEMPAQQQGDCTSTHSPRTGNTMKIAFSCTRPPSRGEGQISFLSPEAYTLKMTTHTTVRGQAETMTMDGSGRWLSADCGAIKPIAMPKK